MLHLKKKTRIMSHRSARSSRFLPYNKNLCYCRSSLQGPPRCVLARVTVCHVPRDAATHDVRAGSSVPLTPSRIPQRSMCSSKRQKPVSRPLLQSPASGTKLASVVYYWESHLVSQLQFLRVNIPPVKVEETRFSSMTRSSVEINAKSLPFSC